MTEDPKMPARWTIEARFGHRPQVVALMREWWRDIALAIGWSPAQCRLLGGSLGARESTLEVEVRIGGLAALEDAWARLGALPAQGEWAQRLAPHVVSGSSGWQVCRVL